MPRWLPWLLFLLAAMAFTVTLWQPESVALRLGLRSMVVERQDQFWNNRLRAHYRRLDAATPAGATIFLGASNIQGLNSSAVRACSANFGIGGERSAELLVRLGDYRSLDRAAAIVVQTGLNDVLRGDDADLQSRFRRILAALPAQKPVMLSSLPRLSPAAERGRMHDVAVVRANRAARMACAERRNCRYVDLYGATTDPRALMEADGIHLNPAGYARWAQLLREALAGAGVSEAPCAGG